MGDAYGPRFPVYMVNLPIAIACLRQVNIPHYAIRSPCEHQYLLTFAFFATLLFIFLLHLIK